MVKWLQVIKIVLFLGVFLVPKGPFYEQISDESCCQSTSEMHCCETTKSPFHHKNQKNNNHPCKDTSCSACLMISLAIQPVNFYSSEEKVSSLFSEEKISFYYLDPFYSDKIKDIWQPPKWG